MSTNLPMWHERNLQTSGEKNVPFFALHILKNMAQNNRKHGSFYNRRFNMNFIAVLTFWIIAETKSIGGNIDIDRFLMALF